MKYPLYPCDGQTPRFLGARRLNKLIGNDLNLCKQKVESYIQDKAICGYRGTRNLRKCYLENGNSDKQILQYQ